MLLNTQSYMWSLPPIAARGHDKSVDYWSLGIFLYELRTGDTPFHDTSEAFTYRDIFQQNEVNYTDFIHANNHLQFCNS